jgi:hypothetical protein
VLLKRPKVGNHWATYCPGLVTGYGPTAGKLWKILHHIVPISPSDSLIFQPLNKQLAGKNLAKDADVKRADTS